MTGANLKRGDVDEGGVGGSSGCIGRGDGGKGAMERTVAIVRDGSREKEGIRFENIPQARSEIPTLYDGSEKASSVPLCAASLRLEKYFLLCCSFSLAWAVLSS